MYQKIVYSKIIFQKINFQDMIKSVVSVYLDVETVMASWQQQMFSVLFRFIALVVKQTSYTYFVFFTVQVIGLSLPLFNAPSENNSDDAVAILPTRPSYLEYGVLFFNVTLNELSNI